MSVLQNLVDLVKFRIAYDAKSEDVEKALKLSLSAFNMMPNITYFSFDDEENIEQLSDILVTYACYVLLVNRSLIEACKEFKVSDGGIVIDTTQIGIHLLEVSRGLWSNWESQVNTIKQSDSFYDDFIHVQ